MMVWIVIVDGHVDMVFDNEYAATSHVKTMRSRWSITNVLEKTVHRL